MGIGQYTIPYGQLDLKLAEVVLSGQGRSKWARTVKAKGNWNSFIHKLPICSLLVKSPRTQ